MPPGASARYVIAKLGGQDVGAIAGPADGAAMWNTYICVGDAGADTRRLIEAGATLRSSPGLAAEQVRHWVHDQHHDLADVASAVCSAALALTQEACR